MIPNKDPLKALSDPLRIQLFELIKESPKTTPELAKLLSKDRMELYHHLKILEQSGLIKSSYNTQRMKEYEALTQNQEIDHVEQTAIIFSNLDPDKQLGMIILSPPRDRVKYHKFKLLLDEIAHICATKIPDEYEILQVQVTTEEKSKSEQKFRKLSQMNRAKSMGSM